MFFASACAADMGWGTGRHTFGSGPSADGYAIAACGRWPMMSPGAVSGRYTRPAVPLARDTCR
eukprot:4649161-Prymnesium_polylepis.1